jgi:hypothetical protein
MVGAARGSDNEKIGSNEKIGLNKKSGFNYESRRHRIYNKNL